MVDAMTPPQESENLNSDEANSDCCGGVIRSETKTHFKPLCPTAHTQIGGPRDLGRAFVEFC